MSSEQPIYLDHAASSPPEAEVVDAMIPWLRELHANPHSAHWAGQRAAAAVESARADVAELVGTSPEFVIFTSGATESNNLALQGFLHPFVASRRVGLTGIEHKSLLAVADALAANGTQRTLLPVDSQGRVSVDGIPVVPDADDEHRNLLAFGHGNNEIGTVQSLQAVAEAARARGWHVHVDAAQSAGRLPIDMDNNAIDFLSISSHKLSGPAGVGALCLASRVTRQLRPIMYGGGQEAGLRPGSLPTALIVGFGAAARLAIRTMGQEQERLERIAVGFVGALGARGIRFELVGDPQSRLPGHRSIRLLGIDAEDLAATISHQVSVSTGSACTSGALMASHVLLGIGLPEAAANEVIRVSFGRSSSEESGLRAAEVIQVGVERLLRRAEVTNSYLQVDG